MKILTHTVIHRGFSAFGHVVVDQANQISGVLWGDGVAGGLTYYHDEVPVEGFSHKGNCSQSN